MGFLKAWWSRGSPIACTAAQAEEQVSYTAASLLPYSIDFPVTKVTPESRGGDIYPLLLGERSVEELAAMFQSYRKEALSFL